MTEKKQLTTKKKIVILLSLTVAILLTTGTLVFAYLYKGSSSPEAPTLVEKVIEYFEQTVYTKKEPEDLGTSNKDVGVMIMDCDSTDIFETMDGIVVCNREGRYVQGTGSFGRLKSMNVLGTGVFKEPVDISDYKNGSIHISLYVDDVSKLQREIWLEFSSSGKSDLNEISFCIPRTVMQDGWNEFYLSIHDARVTKGEADLTKINFFRLVESDYAYGPKILYDNIYATKTKGVKYNSIPPRLKGDAYTETQTTKGKMIMSCNTVNILEGLTNAEVTTEKSKYVEGTGAFKLTAAASTFLLKQPVDISAYKNGSIHVSFYVNDPALLTSSLNLELTSSGTYDKDEYWFTIQAEKLSAGWNHFWLDISSSSVTGSPDLKKINFVRVWTINPNENLELIMDDLYATMDREKDEFAESSAVGRQMIASCNTINIFRSLQYVEVTTKKGEFVEGTGAMKTVGHKGHIMEAVRVEPVDISEYLDGYIHLSLYVNDVSLLQTDVVLELSSNEAKNDVDEYQWGIKRNSLSNGWNECFLKISNAKVRGNMDPTSVSRIRIYGTRSEGVVTIVDNICASHTTFDPYQETASPYGQMIASCNTINVFQSLDYAKVTTADGEFVEGSGAMKSTNYKGHIIEAVLANPVDISKYLDGYVHLSLYVSDVSLLESDIVMELSSYETKNDVDEYQWGIKKSTLTNGWNECFLKISDAKVRGNMDPTSVKRMRIYGTRSEGIVTIVDNICATLNTFDIYEETVSDVGKMIASCNTINIFQVLEKSNVTTTAGEFVEGTGALKSVNHKSVVVMRGILRHTVDISEYSDGYIHMSFYINDTALLNDYVALEISSNEGDDQDEYQWTIQKKDLKKGWNECYLKISDATVRGTVDLTAIKRIRVIGPRTEGAVTIVDNIYATSDKVEEDEAGDGDNLWGPLL